MTVEIEKIECVIDQPGAVASAERILQALKIVRSIRLDRDDLAVDDRLARRQLFCRLCQHGEAESPVLSVSGENGDSAIVDMAKKTIAIEFELIEPSWSFGHRADECGELGRDEVRYPRFIQQHRAATCDSGRRAGRFARCHR
jgi:hypothetical protein